MRERSTRCKDKSAASSAKLATWEREANRQRAGMVTALEVEAGDWVAVPLAKHIADWVAALEGKGRWKRCPCMPRKTGNGGR